ncbi:MAG: pyridoxal phosphate-dependent aminotransferase [Rhodospirillales bacterium]
MAAAARARALRAQGIDVISLTLGEPAFPTPPHVIEAAHQAALHGETKYPPVNGTPALIQAVRAKFQRDSQLDYSADEIIVGHGARQIIYDALTASLEPGCEVIVPAPYWNAYPLIARMAGAEPVFLPCSAADGYLPRPETINAAITPRTRWLMLNFPNNPTGAVCSAARLADIATVMRAHPQVWIMCDDIYEHLIHDGSAHATMAAVAPDLASRVLTVSGVSKTYAMTGWRVGFAGGPARLIRAMSRVQGQSTGGVSPVAQAAAVAALEGPQDLVARMRTTYAARGQMVAAALAAIPGVRCAAPRAAFYVFPDISGVLGRTAPSGKVLATDAELADALLADAHVGCVHGAAFGAPGHLRISTAADDEPLREACRRIATFCASLH